MGYNALYINCIYKQQSVFLKFLYSWSFPSYVYSLTPNINTMNKAGVTWTLNILTNFLIFSFDVILSLYCFTVSSFSSYFLKRLIMTNSRKLLHRSSINVNVNAQRSANSILSLKSFGNNHKTIFGTERNSLMYPIKFYGKHPFLFQFFIRQPLIE